MINYIAIHHAGGFLKNPLASTRHLTFDDINNAHKNRRDWIGYRAHLSELNYYVGYTFVYDPKTRVFAQTRLIGEETLAQKGFNFNTIAICIIGNYSKIPGTQLTVDLMTTQMEKDIALFTQNLISGNHKYYIQQGTKIDITPSRVHPHRWFQKTTACYGSGLLDSWISNILAKYKVIKLVHSTVIEERLRIMQMILKIYREMLAILEKRKVGKMQKFASIHNHACTGIVNSV